MIKQYEQVDLSIHDEFSHYISQYKNDILTFDFKE